MAIKSVKELVIPVDEYAVVSRDATLLDAIRVLRVAQSRMAPDRQPPRAVLVVDSRKRVIGQLGYLDILKAAMDNSGAA